MFVFSFPAGCLRFTGNIHEPAKFPGQPVFCASLLMLLEEDGWLSSLAKEDFDAVFGNHLDHRQKGLISSLSGMHVQKTFTVEVGQNELHCSKQNN
jgi:hypothetical protein